jgi:hypothetical protein
MSDLLPVSQKNSCPHRESCQKMISSLKQIEKNPALTITVTASVDVDRTIFSLMPASSFQKKEHAPFEADVLFLS